MTKQKTLAAPGGDVARKSGKSAAAEDKGWWGEWRGEIGERSGAGKEGAAMLRAKVELPPRRPR